MIHSKPTRLTRYIIPNSHFLYNSFPPLEAASETGGDTYHFLWKFSSARADKDFGSSWNKPRPALGLHILCKDSARVQLDRLIPVSPLRSTEYVSRSIIDDVSRPHPQRRVTSAFLFTGLPILTIPSTFF